MMKKSLLLLLIGCQCALFSQNAPVIAVLDFQILNVPDLNASVVNDLAISSLVKSGDFKVIDRSKRDKLLREQQFSLSDVTDVSAQIETGKMLAANRLVSGVIGKINDTIIVSIKLLDVETGEVLRSSMGSYVTLNSLIAGVDDLVTNTICADDKGESNVEAVNAPELLMKLGWLNVKSKSIVKSKDDELKVKIVLNAENIPAKSNKVLGNLLYKFFIDSDPSLKSAEYGDPEYVVVFYTCPECDGWKGELWDLINDPKGKNNKKYAIVVSGKEMSLTMHPADLKNPKRFSWSFFAFVDKSAPIGNTGGRDFSTSLRN